MFEKVGAEACAIEQGAAAARVVHHHRGARVDSCLRRASWSWFRAVSLRPADPWVADAGEAKPLHHDLHGMRVRLVAAAVVALEAESPPPNLERFPVRGRIAEQQPAMASVAA